MNSSTKQFLKECVFSVALFIFIIPGLVGRITHVPSGSMRPTLQEGDVVVLSKLHYGAKTPSTLLQLPFLEKKYVSWIKVPSVRLPGFTKIKRCDCVVFHAPTELAHPRDQRTYYVKRCVGMPGDGISMRRGRIYIEGEALVLPKGVELQQRYKVYVHGFRYTGKAARFLKGQGLTETFCTDDSDCYVVYMTASQAERLEACEEVRAVKASFDQAHYEKVPYYDYGGYFFMSLRGNLDNFPRVVVPKKGMEIVINERTLAIYGHLIRHHEGHKEVVIDREKATLCIDGELFSSYTFGQDYYMMMGDNRPGSSDSRIWGFVPKDHIVAKPVLIVMRKKHPTWWLPLSVVTLQVDWKRFFHLIR